MRIGAGTVYLVGAGPGAPDLITVKGMRLLLGADVILYDRLVSPELLQECSEHTELISVGKTPGKSSIAQEEINRILIDRALQGKSVVRLKGGDPFVFGRGGEELMACRRAGVRCVVIPGVSSILAVPAAAGVPVTHRGMVRSMAVVTGQADPAGHGHPIPDRAQGRNIMDGPLPFLLGIPPDKALARYRLSVISETKTEVRLQIYPRWKSDSANYKSAKVVLSKTQNYLPSAVRMTDPSGKNKITVYVFDKMIVNNKGVLNWFKRK
ncbi:MAG: uroporphyrinogen-III C-methyltransferase, partial [Acidobacteria bacterium]|nr:uroporphyrinogen-III C-methyltransferase [Acidobacteriota bacterium]